MLNTPIYYVFVKFYASGGDYVNLDHVKVLNQHGFNAKVLFLGHDLKIFTNQLRTFTDVPIVTWQEIDTSINNIFVAPESYPFMFNGSINFGNNYLILHNQNYLFSCDSFSSINALNYHTTVSNVILPSLVSAVELTKLGCDKPIHIVQPYIPSYFTVGEKQKQPIKIVYSARKREKETNIVWFYFKSLYQSAYPVEIINVQNLPRQEVAKHMREAAIFASFAERESLGLMALEAMASGCHVVGFSGHSDTIDNFVFNDENGDWIREGDYMSYAQKLCEAVEIFAQGRENPKVTNGLKLINSQFRFEHFERILLETWHNILTKMA